MLILLSIIITVFIFISIISYYNYIARYHRIHLYGNTNKKLISFNNNKPVFNLDDILLKKEDAQILNFIKNRHLPVVVCLGDSITNGIISTNYVEYLQEKYQDRCIFINSGINGNLVYNLNLRLKNDCIDFRPDYITILIGTNDVNSQKSNKIQKKYVKYQQLPQNPDINFFKQNLEKMISQLKQKTSAKIAILSIPLNGEELDSMINKKVTEYNIEIKKIANNYNLTYLPLNEIQRDFLKQNKHRNPTRYLKKNIIKNMLFMVGRSFDKIAKINGRYLTYDGLHLTTKGALIIVDLIASFLNSHIIKTF